MTWSSKTGHFDSLEISELENMSVEHLIPKILRSDPLVALRCLVEIKLNGDHKKLHQLLLNKELRNHWRSYETDQQADGFDANFSFSLERFIKTRRLE